MEALTDSLKETVAELRSRFGWKPKDRVRFIFHRSFKKYKDVEAEAVKASRHLLQTSKSNMRSSMSATLTTGCCLTAPPPGKVWQFDQVKIVPQRGQCVPLRPNTALFTLSGPYQVKTAQQGCPHRSC